ncbi:prolipoprotein diacylglyceryl transferase [Candidatus Shapirobacteria bacterium]|nr:prolipoprotein diacylglyceryl transferase [Candidatus Shapirobacteria bacterium]
MSLYGLIIGIAIIIGLNYFEKHQNLIPKNQLLLFEAGLLISAIIGARAYHVIDQWSFYSQNPWLIPATWNGGLGIFGALLGGSVFIVLFLNLKSYFLLLNFITPILPLCQAIGRLGNFVNHENPLWLPEAVGDLLLFFFIQKFPQNPTAKYLLGYGLIRFITEFWRTDTWVYQNFKIGQIISLVFILTGLWLLPKNHQLPSKKPLK